MRPAKRQRTMNPPLVVLTGPVRSGKTTRLATWVRARAAAGEPVAGILAPATTDERSLCSIATGECRVLTAAADVSDEHLVAIGPHRFDGEVFDWARGVIAEAGAGSAAAGSAGPRPGWLVVDEVGPLELGGAGLEPAVRTAVTAALGRRASARLLLVVRESLVNRALDHYGVPASAVRVVTPAGLAARDGVL